MLNQFKITPPVVGIAEPREPYSSVVWEESNETITHCVRLKEALDEDLIDIVGSKHASRFWQLAAIRTSLCLQYCHDYAVGLLPSIAVISMFKDIGILHIRSPSINPNIVDGYLRLFKNDIFQFDLNACESNFGIFYRGIESADLLEKHGFDEIIGNAMVQCTTNDMEFDIVHHDQQVLICRQASLIAALIIHYSFEQRIPTARALNTLLEISKNNYWRRILIEESICAPQLIDSFGIEDIDLHAMTKAIKLLI